VTPLDYAANGVVYWPTERLRPDFEGHCASDGREPEEVCEESLGDQLDPDRFWDDAEQHFRSSRVRLIFVSDLIMGWRLEASREQRGGGGAAL
jgi:hypothetical protein